MKQPIFLAIAYRWGWANNDWYIVGAGLDEGDAVAMAEAECEGRGGKYGVAVLKLTDTEDSQIAYFPSSYGEKEPHANWRIDTAGSLGIEVLVAAEDGQAFLPSPDEPGRLVAQQVTLPDWLVRRAKEQSEVSKIMCEDSPHATAINRDPGPRTLGEMEAWCKQMLQKIADARAGKFTTLSD